MRYQIWHYVGIFIVLVLSACSASSTTHLISSGWQLQLTSQIDGFVPTTVRGVGVTIARQDSILYTHAAGNLAVDAVVPLASATKLPSATAIMTLVDQGKLDLATPIATYLTGKIMWPADKQAITMEMLLAHTSGLNQDTCIGDQASQTLQQCAQAIANDPLTFPPGTQFAYEGADYQVAGYVAEVLAGSNWATFFAQSVATPLGMQHFTYGNTRNPRIAGGASAAMADYIPLLQMHLAKGVYQGKRILSTSSIALMRQDRVGNLAIHNSPGAAGHLNGYGLGWWISDACLYPGSPGPEYSDQGAFGYTPWIDVGLGYAGVIMIQQRTQTGTQIWNALRPTVTGGLTGATPAPSLCSGS